LNTFTTRQQTFAQKQNEFIDAFTMVHHSSNSHIQLVMNRATNFLTQKPKILTLQSTKFDFILTYKFSVFATAK